MPEIRFNCYDTINLNWNDLYDDLKPPVIARRPEVDVAISPRLREVASPSVRNDNKGKDDENDR
jgi:hypothetical protein